MPIDYDDHILDILREVAGKIFSEAPDTFVNNVVSTRHDLVALGNSGFFNYEQNIKQVVNDLFDSERYKKYPGLRINMGDIDIIGLSLQRYDYSVESKRNNAFILLHELAHITDNHFNEQHQRELYADTLAHLLLIRESNKKDLSLVKKIPFAKASNILISVEGDIGRYYSTNALLAVNDFTAQNNIKGFNLHQLIDVAKDITKKFSLAAEIRKDLFNRAASGITAEPKDALYWEKLLSSMEKTADKEAYKIYRQISLSEELQNEVGIKKANTFLKKRDKEMGFILNPLQDKESPPLKAVGKLKYSCL